MHVYLYIKYVHIIFASLHTLFTHHMYIKTEFCCFGLIYTVLHYIISKNPPIKSINWCEICVCLTAVLSVEATVLAVDSCQHLACGIQ